MKKIRVGVIFGGRSGEHEVSLASAEAVIKALDKSKYEVVPIGITKKGKWLTTSNPLTTLKSGSNLSLDTENIITPDATRGQLIAIKKKYFATPYSNSLKLNIIIPILHGTYGEDGTIQGLFELANIPYVGANTLASAVGMDKIIQKQLFIQACLPVVNFIYFLSKNFKKESVQLYKQVNKLGYPVFVKPANLGSSVGISKAHNKSGLRKAIEYAIHYDRKIIIEKAVSNPREIEISVLGNDSPQASVAGEIVTSGEFYDYDAKYVDGKSRSVIPADIPEKTSTTMREMAIKAFKSIDCSGMARVDFLLTKNGKFYISEVNTIPGFTSISMYPLLWKASGVSYPKLLDKLIALALERHKEKSKLQTSYKPKEKWYR